MSAIKRVVKSEFESFEVREGGRSELMEVEAVEGVRVDSTMYSDGNIHELLLSNMGRLRTK